MSTRGGAGPVVRRNLMPRFKLLTAKRMRRNPTPGEAAVWAVLRKRQLGFRVRRQAPMWGYIVDFYVPAARLVIEVDGGYHSEPEQMRYDSQRDQHLEAHGLTVLRVTEALAVANPEIVAFSIRRHLENLRASR